MKKAISVFSIITASLAIFAGNVFGQSTAKDLPMLRSKEALKAYALQQAGTVNVSISSFLPGSSKSGEYFSASFGTATELLTAIKNVKLSVDVANPKDPLYSMIAVYSGGNDLLFFGYRQFNLVQGKGDSYSLPADYGDVEMTMSDNIPIPIDGAQSAFVDLLDANGKSSSFYSLTVQDGKVYFPRQLAGSNMILGIYTGSGWSYWNAEDGTAIDYINYAATIQPSIQGVNVLAVRDANITIQTVNGIGHNQLAELAPYTNSWIYVSFRTSEGHKSQDVMYRKRKGGVWSGWQLMDKTSNYIFVYGDETIQLIPIWNPNDFTEPADPWTPPYDGGGKG